MTRSCFYHPTEPAVAVCENCGKPVCISCNLIFRKKYSSNNHRYVENYRYCPECKYNREANGEPGQKFGFMIFGIFIVVFISFPLLTVGINFFLDGPGIMFLIVPMIMLIAILNEAFIQGPNRKKQAMDNLELFRRQIGEKMEGNYNPPNFIYNKRKLFCNQCGSEISMNAKYCEHCGDTTEDEHY